MTTPQALLTNVQNFASGTIANLPLGAQLGLGAHLPVIDAATPLVFPPIVPIVLQAPRFMEGVPKAEEVLKALYEQHAKEISGIDFGLQVETGETPAGHDGQTLKMPTNTKRTTVSPSFVLPEVNGNLVYRFNEWWITQMKDPDTQASTMSGIVAAGSALSPQVISTISMTMLFIQYDVTFRPENIIDAFIITNMFPTETGMPGWKRQIGQSQVQDRTIPFTGVAQKNKNTLAVGREIAQLLAIHTIDYTVSEPVATTVAASLRDLGLRREVQQAAADFVPL